MKNNVLSGRCIATGLKYMYEKEEFDYVLIDSRTGFSDVSGICTRQLPNTVVLLYMLDKQNREIVQIKKMIDEHKKSATSELQDRCKDIIYVESNIPFLDDL